MLDEERRRLEETATQYQDLVERGADALNRYTREIAYRDDEMARAGTLALLFNQVAWTKGRIGLLERTLEHHASRAPDRNR